MKFFLTDHQGKGYPYAQALEVNGWERVNNAAEEIRLAFYDMDAGDNRGFRRGLDMLHERGVPVMIYPHSGRPSLFWDGMYEIWPHTRAFIAIAEGHREIMRMYGYPLPVEVCGWAMCELRDFQPVKLSDKPLEVLFAPIHPNRNGWLHPAYRAYNTIIFQKLLETPGIRLSVRHIMSLALNGIWQAPGVKCILGTTKPATEQIDEADLIIAHQTFPFLAAARGKPLIMAGDDMNALSGNAWDNIRWAVHYDDYRELLRYPLEAEAARSGRAFRAMIERACSEDCGGEWRERLIGRPFNPKYFVETVERYL